MKSNHFVVIMAGGVGTRFWPSSTNEKPKQFLDILGIGKSLLRMTYERFIKIVDPDHILIVTNKQYFDLVAEDLPELPKANILLEPSRNNTAPCVAYAMLRLLKQDPNAVFVTAPSDHVILKEDDFLDIMKDALKLAEEKKAIVTCGIKPTRPDTGYGYIRVDNAAVVGEMQAVKEFKEKPDLQTATRYVDSGNYLWNGGIFVWRADQLLADYLTYAPEIIHTLNAHPHLFGTEGEQAYIDEVYPNTPNISIDYAILENAKNVFTIPADIGWSDLGTWTSLHSYLGKDDNDTVTIGDQTFLIDTKNSIIRSDSKKIVVIKGLVDYIVVDEKDALLIYPKSEEQDIKKVVQQLLN